MIKKLILAVVALAALGAVYAIDPGGHCTAVTSYVSKWFKGKVNLDYELTRAEGLVARLDDSIKENQEFLAREKVELAKLGDSVEKDRVAVQKKHDRVVAMRNNFGKGEQLVSVDPGKRNELARELSQLKIMDRKYETNRKILDVRKQRFESLRDKVTEMQSAKDTMRLKVEELRANLEAVRLDETHAKQYSVDDSEYKRAHELLDYIDTEIKVREETVAMRRASDDSPVAKVEENPNVLQDVDAYLAGK
jgi:hypothetical protein